MFATEAGQSYRCCESLCARGAVKVGGLLSAHRGTNFDQELDIITVLADGNWIILKCSKIGHFGLSLF